MKRLLVVSLALLSLVFGVKEVSAMTEAALKEKMSQTITINGGDFSLTEDAKNYLERYLNQYEVSEADCQYIADRFDEAVNIIKNSGKSKVEDLSKTTKNELKALVEKVSANTSVKATVTKDTVVVYKPEGGKFAEVSDPIKQTGAETSPIAYIAGISFLITIAGAVLAVKQVKSN